MVPDTPSLTRRRALGGVAALLTGAITTLGLTVPTALPDTLTDWATNAYPAPPESIWQPEVTESHASEAVDRLATAVTRGETLWTRLDADEIPENERFIGAGGWLDNAQEDLDAGKYHEALFDATYGMQFAGESLGVASALNGKTDAQSLAERGFRLLDRTDELADTLDEYRVRDPARDLAWYYRVEQELLFARLNASWGGMETVRDGAHDDKSGSGSREYDAHDIGQLWAGMLQAEQRVRNAERYHRQVSEMVASGGIRYASHLQTARETFRASVSAYPSRETVWEGLPDGDGPHAFARRRLARSCFDTSVFALSASDGLLVYQAVEFSKALTQRRAYGDALSELVVDSDDEGFDSGHVLREKRRSMAAYRSVVGPTPPPLLAVQANRALEDIQVAQVAQGGVAGSHRRPLWKARLNAYLYALVGRVKLRQYRARSTPSATGDEATGSVAIRETRHKPLIEPARMDCRDSGV